MLHSHPVERRQTALRVLHVHSGNLYGGVETFLLTLARQQTSLPALQHHFALCFEGRLSDQLIGMGMPVHFLGNVRGRKPKQLWAARKRLRTLLSNEHFEVVIYHSTWAQGLFGSLARGSGATAVFWLHVGLQALTWAEMWTYLLSRLTTPDMAICDSRFTLNTLSRLYPGIRSELLYYPVAPGQADVSSRSSLRQQLATPDDDVVIIQTSRLEPWKGHKLHIQALANLCELPGWTCWIVGGAQRSQEERYLFEIQNLVLRAGLAGRVRFLGQRHDIPQLLRAADIHCQPNMGPEPFGITFIEALYAGLPLVTTRIGGALEIVDDSCGILVPEGDAAELSNALRRLIIDRARLSELGTGGPVRARTLCDPVQQVDKLFQLLGDVRNLPASA
jgi:glycosyltransferase involved in cell wall biosynthesis